MRNFFLLLVFIFGSLPSFAQYLPHYLNPSFYYGEELISISSDINIYSDKSVDSDVIAKVKLKSDVPYIIRADKKKADVFNTFIAYSIEDNIALLPVIENDDEWYKVLYSQKDKLTGWVKKSDNIDFFSWIQFMNVYGRKKGVYLFRDIPDNYKKLYAKADESSKVVDEFNFAKHISIWLVASNWALVKVTTYDGKTKTGWMQWRTKKGTLLAFPDLEQF